MRRCNVGPFGLAVRLVVLALANAPTLLLAANACEREALSTRSDAQQYYMILAGQTDVFYDRSGPTFVMLQRTAADETDVGAFGIYAGERKQPVFGPVPASVYERFVSESRKPSDVLLRLAISQPQYERALKVLQTWERRVRENALLYPEIAMDNILLVKQATEELNRCSADARALRARLGAAGRHLRAQRRSAHSVRVLPRARAAQRRAARRGCPMTSSQ